MSQNSLTMTGDNSYDSYKRNPRRVRRRVNRDTGGFTAEQEEFVRDLADIFHRSPPRASGSSFVSKKNLVLEVKKLGVVYFTEAGGVEPSVAEYWLENTERQMSHAICDSEDKYMVVVSLLQDEAYRWWKPIGDNTPPAEQTWDFFVDEFRKKYVGFQYMKAIRKEFISLKQGSMRVKEYEYEFNKLSRYALELVRDEAHRVELFLDGLRGEDRSNGDGKEISKEQMRMKEAERAWQVGKFVGFEVENDELARKRLMEILNKFDKK